jgi:hypothetical protein
MKTKRNEKATLILKAALNYADAVTCDGVVTADKFFDCIEMFESYSRRELRNEQRFYRQYGM